MSRLTADERARIARVVARFQATQRSPATGSDSNSASPAPVPAASTTGLSETPPGRAVSLGPTPSGECPNCDGRCWWIWPGDQRAWCKACHPGVRALLDETGVIREKHWIGCPCGVCVLLDPPVAVECECGACQPLVMLQAVRLAEHSR